MEGEGVAGGEQVSLPTESQRLRAEALSQKLHDIIVGNEPKVALAALVETVAVELLASETCTVEVFMRAVARLMARIVRGVNAPESSAN